MHDGAGQIDINVEVAIARERDNNQAIGNDDGIGVDGLDSDINRREEQSLATR